MFKGIVIGIPGFVAVVIIAPITEELFFRGIILNGLLLIYKPIKSIFVSALLFGLIHLNPWQLLPAITAGILIGWIYYKTNNILLCILIHGFNNASNFFMEKLEFNLPGLTKMNQIALNKFTSNILRWIFIQYNKPLLKKKYFQGSFKAPSINNSVEIIRDKWHIPHIYAQNLNDLFSP